MKSYIGRYPATNIGKLFEVFPFSIQGQWGVFTSLEQAESINNGTTKKGTPAKARYKTKPNELIKVGVVQIATSNQWNPQNVAAFITIATDLGFEIAAVSE